MTESSDPFTLLSRELGDRTLTPDQLAQVRALNTRYFTRLYAIRARATDAADLERQLTTLHDEILAEIRRLV